MRFRKGCSRTAGTPYDLWARTLMMRHIARLARANQLRFRAEAFGLFFPALPNGRPFWRMSPVGLVLLTRAFGRYRVWHARMLLVARGDAHDWWGAEWPAIDLEGELTRLSREEEMVAS
jgi:hypothetical protein